MVGNAAIAMNVCVTTEQRFYGTRDGGIWTPSTFSYLFWRRYLDVFETVRVIARVRVVASAQDSWVRVDGKNVAFYPVPYYHGPWQFILRFKHITDVMKRAIGPPDAVILRVPSAVSGTIQSSLRRQRRPFALEVVGDPYDVFAPGAIKHPLRAIFRWWFTRQLRVQCQLAGAVAFVTENSLQRRFPPGPDTFTTHYSSITLGEEWFTSLPNRSAYQTPRRTIITVGTFEQLYKGPDTLIDAVGMCRAAGYDLRLVMIGDGAHRTMLEAKANARLGDSAVFLGMLPSGELIRRELDRADLFVLPSRTEGLPRAMIEAMARGLPCVGSTAGGIPELLPPEDLTPPGDATALANKIREVLSDPVRMAKMSARNLEKAREYHNDVLRERRIAFYRYLREYTESWIKSQGK